jgi:hypothetical protein
LRFFSFRSSVPMKWLSRTPFSSSTS